MELTQVQYEHIAPLLSNLQVLNAILYVVGTAASGAARRNGSAIGTPSTRA